MKKFILMILACLLAVSAVACGQETQTETQTVTTVTTQSATEPAPTTEPTPPTLPQMQERPKLPYGLILDAELAIRKEPSLESAIVRPLGVDGTYQFVKEHTDSEGNLWGYLKTGEGWVKLSGERDRITRICPQCHIAEPEVSFPETWRVGTICNSCSEANN